SGEPGFRLENGAVYGVGGDYDGQLLASNTTTTAEGRSFLLGTIGLREATPHEVQLAREATTPGVMMKWPSRSQQIPQPSSVSQYMGGFDEPSTFRPEFVNEFGFDTGSTNGWWVVKDE
ncbi:MAG: hypothetical protein AAF492_20030, partial [Verrucomicrobiota bacterium]